MGTKGVWGGRKELTNQRGGDGGRGEGKLISKPKLQKLKDVTNNDCVHMHHEKCRIQAGLRCGLSFEG